MSRWEVGGTTYQPGCLLAADLDAWLEGGRELTQVWAPGPGESLTGMTATRSRFMLSVLRDVSSAVVVLDPEHGWSSSELPVPPLSSASVWPVDDEDPDCAEDYWLTSSSFLTPATLYRGSLSHVGNGATGAAVSDGARPGAAGSGAQDVGPWPAPALIASAPERFDASTHRVSQHFAVSDDGTRVPYFLLAPADDPMDGRTPVVINAYGGFRSWGWAGCPAPPTTDERRPTWWPTCEAEANTGLSGTRPHCVRTGCVCMRTWPQWPGISPPVGCLHPP
jgi:prolyl oligopeptidase